MAVKEAPTAALAPPPGDGRPLDGRPTTRPKKNGLLDPVNTVRVFALAEQVGTGQDLWIVGLILVGTASILGGINFVVTILRMRAPGMTMMRMPVFTWSILATSLLVILAAPVLTAGLIMVFADRQLGTTFFDPNRGGVVILWQNVFWFFGHPEVSMLILGA